MSDSAGVAEVVTRHTDVVLISGSDPNRLAQHLSVIDAAKSADVRHVYYTSGVRADDDRRFRDVRVGEVRVAGEAVGELASFLVNLDETIAAGAFARVSDDLSRLLGRPTTRLVDGPRAP